MSDGIDIRITGLEAVAAALAGLSIKARAQVVGPALRREIKPMLRMMKYLAPRRTGLLAESLGVRSRSYRGGRILFAAVGPRSGFKLPVILPSGRTIWANPVNYAHLVEYGTRTAPKHPFMRPAYDACAPAIVANMGCQIARGIERLAARAARKAG